MRFLFLVVCLFPSIALAQPQRIERNVARSKATLALAEADRSWKDGELVDIRGLDSDGDGGGQRMIYHASGWSAGGFSEGPFYQRIGSTDAYFEAVDKTVANVKAAGATGDGSTDDTTAIQSCLDQVASGNQILIPPGTYQVSNLSFANSNPTARTIAIQGYGATLRARTGASYILRINGEFIRDVPLTISGLRFNGNSVSNVIGLQTVGSITNVHVSDCSFIGCNTGADFQDVLNLHVQDTVFSTSTVGMKVQQGVDTDANGNANLFTNVELYNNTIGAILDGNDDNPSIEYPMAGNQFIGGTIQNNNLCGLAAIDTNRVILQGVHFEANGGTGTTLDVDSNTIRRSNIHLYKSQASIKDVGLQTPSPNIILEAGSQVKFVGEVSYSSSVGDMVQNFDLNENNAAYVNGATIWGSGFSTTRLFGDFTIRNFGTRFSFLKEPKFNYSKKYNNIAPSDLVPTLTSILGAVGQGTDTDAQWGTIRYVDFSASAGNTSTNRAIINCGLGTVATNEEFIVTLLAKASEVAQFRFDITSGTFAYIQPTLDNNWVKVVMVGRASSTQSPSLYIYPLDDTGARLSLSHLFAYKVGASDLSDPIFDILANDYFEYDGMIDLGQTKLIDEDDMASDSSVDVPTQQSVKAYNDSFHGYAQISVENNSTATTVASTQSDWSAKSQFVGFADNAAEMLSATPDHTNDHITINSGGVWEVTATLTLSGSVASDLWELAFFVDNGSLKLTPKQGVNIIHAGFTYSNQVTVSGLATLSENDTVELWVQRTNGTGTLTITNAVMTATKVSD